MFSIDGATVKRVKNTIFLGDHVTDDLSWTGSARSLTKKMQQCLPKPILSTFYRGTIECILTSWIRSWYGD